MAKTADATTFGLTSRITFGQKYKGQIVSDVVTKDPGWILWAQENVEFANFSLDVLALCQDNPTTRFVIKKQELDEHTEQIAILHAAYTGKSEVVTKSLKYFMDLAYELRKTL